MELFGYLKTAIGESIALIGKLITLFGELLALIVNLLASLGRMEKSVQLAAPWREVAPPDSWFGLRAAN